MVKLGTFNSPPEVKVKKYYLLVKSEDIRELEELAGKVVRMLPILSRIVRKSDT